MDTLYENLVRWREEALNPAIREEKLLNKLQLLSSMHRALEDKWAYLNFGSMESDLLESEMDEVTSAIMHLLPEVIKILQFREVPYGQSLTSNLTEHVNRNTESSGRPELHE